MSRIDLLTAQLWDLRAQAESKLRCLTRVQQLLLEHERSTDPHERAQKRNEILKDLSDILTISNTLRSVAEEALAEAKTALPTS